MNKPKHTPWITSLFTIDEALVEIDCLTEINTELLEACIAALSEYHPTARDGDPIAEQLMAAIAKAKGNRK